MIPFAIAAVLGATTFWVLAPLLGWAGEEAEAPEPAAEEQERLLAVRRELLSSIKDLDMEHQVGKLSPEDYQETRERLTREAVAVLRRIDEEAGPGPRGADPVPEDSRSD
jgi:hypothetical protein